MRGRQRELDIPRDEEEGVGVCVLGGVKKGVEPKDVFYVVINHLGSGTIGGTFEDVLVDMSTYGMEELGN